MWQKWRGYGQVTGVWENQVCGGVVWLQSLTHCSEVCPNLGAGAVHACGRDMALAYPPRMCKVTDEKPRWRLFLYSRLLFRLIVLESIFL